MKMSKTSLRVYASGLAASALLACIDPSPPTEPTSPDTVTVENCQKQIAARQAEVTASGTDLSTWSIEDAPEMADPGLTAKQTPATYTQYDGRYRPLTNHPGCSTENLYYNKENRDGSTPYVDGNIDGKWNTAAEQKATDHVDGDMARITGYDCAAKQYTQPDEDTSKPIVILVHGNSTRPHSWEKFLLPPNTAIVSAENVTVTPDTTARTQLAERLISERYQVVAVDFRTDLWNTAEPISNNTEYNAAGNIDHGWSTPILQSLIKAVMKNNPNRKVALVGHSLGVTVVRDALRRLYVEHTKGLEGAINPFPQVSHVVLGSGANHGVATYDSPYLLCSGKNKTMRGTIVCEMGSRSNYVQTYFHKPLNGPRDLFATPCADGDYAFGRTGQCGGNVVKYFSITMTDIQQGSNYQDLYVSEAASRIDMPGCVVNKLTTRSDYDTSGYFLKGGIANHFGSVRSEAGLNLVMDYLAQ